MTTVTPNFKFVLPDFNQKPWQQAYYDALNAIDALLQKYIVVNNYQGPWQNATMYSAGQVVVDLTSGLLFKCLIGHTSTVAPNTFLQDRQNNPTFWQAYTFAVQFRGVWQAATTYAAGDFVTFSKKLAVCTTNHTSTAFLTDLGSGFWSVVVDGDVLTPFPTLSGNAADKGRVAVVDPTGTFYTITPQGIGWQNANSQWQVAGGSAAFPSLNFQPDPTTGLFSVAAGQLGISISGVLVAKFVSTGFDGAGIKPNSVANTALAQVPSFTVKGNPTNATANAADMTSAQLALVLGLRDYIAGLITSNDGVAPNTKIDVAAGIATEDTNTFGIVYAGGACDCTVNGLNGLDTGALANNTWYHLFLIAKADGSVPGLLASTSPTAPTFPGTYTLKRRIASFKTDGAAHILAYTQIGETFRWVSPALDVLAVASSGVLAVSRTLSTPLGVVCRAQVTVRQTAGAGGEDLYVSELTAADQAAGNNDTISLSGTSRGASYGEWHTNTSSQIRTRQSIGGATEALTLVTTGWVDYRGRWN